MPYLKQAAKSSKDTGLNCNRAAIVNMSTILSSIAGNETGGLYPYRTSKVSRDRWSVSISYIKGKESYNVELLVYGV